MPVERPRFPDLKRAAVAGEDRLLGDAGVAQQILGQHHAPLGVEGELMGDGEDAAEVVALVGELVETVVAFDHLLDPVVAAALERGELRVRVDDDAGEGLVGKRGAERGRNGHPALFVDLVNEPGQEESHRYPRRPGRTGIASRNGPIDPAPGPIWDVLGYHGIAWASMGRPSNSMGEANNFRLIPRVVAAKSEEPSARLSFSWCF